MALFLRTRLLPIPLLLALLLVAPAANGGRPAGGGADKRGLGDTPLAWYDEAPPAAHETGTTAGALSGSGPLDAGYREMYDLQFADAHRTFQEWEKTHPQDPLAFSSDAAAYLYDEFNRLGVLQSDLFVDDARFKKRTRPSPDPVLEQELDQSLAHSDSLANAVLHRNPKDSEALFAKLLNLGLRSDDAALVQKRNLAALGYMKSADSLSQRLLAVDPACYDAYLASGIENYILSLDPAPLRWVLRLYGARTDKQQGIEKLRLTATKGHYLQPFARLLLAVAALRDHQPAEARELLAGLARQFPHNPLYRRELDRIQ